MVRFLLNLSMFSGTEKKSTVIVLFGYEYMSVERTAGSSTTLGMGIVLTAKTCRQ